MIPDPVIVIIGGTGAVTCGVCVIIAFRAWIEERAQARRFAAMNDSFRANAASLLELRRAIDGLTPIPPAELTKKIVPLRPESA